jgi:hypothetical protein
MNARRLLVAFAFTTVVAPAALAQDQATSAAEALLDKMTGPWVMTGDQTVGLPEDLVEPVEYPGEFLVGGSAEAFAKPIDG